jgi:hypothetical protein
MTQSRVLFYTRKDFGFMLVDKDVRESGYRTERLIATQAEVDIARSTETRCWTTNVKETDKRSKIEGRFMTNPRKLQCKRRRRAP